MMGGQNSKKTEKIGGILMENEVRKIVRQEFEAQKKGIMAELSRTGRQIQDLEARLKGLQELIREGK